MLQSSIHISEEQGILVNASNSTLVLQLGNGYLSYSITDDIAKKVHTLTVYNYSGNGIDAIRALLEKHPELKNDFGKRYFIADTASSVLIPGSIADDTLSRQVLQHSIGDLSNAKVLEQELPERGAVCCFAIPKPLEEYLCSNFPGIAIKHLHAAWLQAKPSTGVDVKLCFLYQQMHVCIQKEDQLLLMQQYTFETPDDALYAILNAADQLHIDLKDCSIVLEGMIDQQSALAIKLQQYLPHIVWNVPSFNQFPASADQYPGTFLAFQDTLLSCVL